MLPRKATDGAGYGSARAVVIACAVAVLLAGCSETRFVARTAKAVDPAAPAGAGGTYKIGNPYQIGGVWYYPAADPGYTETGIASWYGPKFHGRSTANGETFDMNRLTAAHRTLPMPSVVLVTNLENGRSLRLRVNDRGPFAHGRIIDVSRRGAQLLGFQRQGTARVRVEYLPAESAQAVARLRGGPGMAQIETPITVNRMPKAPVGSESLPPPAGGVAAPSIDTPIPAAAGSTAADRLPPAPTDVGPVTVAPVEPTTLYVQAGAFSVFENANRLRARLSTLGAVQVSQVLVEGRDFYRVRIGPLASLDQADVMLERLIHAGFRESRIVVD